MPELSRSRVDRLVFENYGDIPVTPNESATLQRLLAEIAQRERLNFAWAGAVDQSGASFRVHGLANRAFRGEAREQAVQLRLVCHDINVCNHIGASVGKIVEIIDPPGAGLTLLRGAPVIDPIAAELNRAYSPRALAKSVAQLGLQDAQVASSFTPYTVRLVARQALLCRHLMEGRPLPSNEEYGQLSRANDVLASAALLDGRFVRDEVILDAQRIFHQALELREEMGGAGRARLAPVVELLAERATHYARPHEPAPQIAPQEAPRGPMPATVTVRPAEPRRAAPERSVPAPAPALAQQPAPPGDSPAPNRSRRAPAPPKQSSAEDEFADLRL